MKPEHVWGLFAVCAVWVLIDGWRRGAVGGAAIYAGLSLLLAPFVVPIYLARRPLRAGEVREGGAAWNILKNFAVLWTLAMLAAAISYFAEAGQVVGKATTDAEKTGAGLGVLMGMGFLGAVWFFPVLGALVFGLLMKKSAVIERGPASPPTG